MIILFIDTNVFLSFYHLTSEDIEELKKLVVLVDSKEVQLIVPKQVENEFWRNRGAKISDAMKKLRDAKFNASFPAFSKDYSEYEEIRGLLKKVDRLHSDLMSNIAADAESASLKADQIVRGLFAKATRPVFEQRHYHSAVMRVKLGNPPGKNESIGDAVNWETLLESVREGEDLYFVSEDKDYRSQLSDGVFNEFLMSEWDVKKSSKLRYYSKISDFFKEKFPDIKLASQIESDRAIAALSSGGSFSSTHFHIEKLNSFDQFTPAQVERLIGILDQNTQVSWIIGDRDVYNFYAKILSKYSGVMNKNDRERLTTALELNEPEVDDLDAL